MQDFQQNDLSPEKVIIIKLIQTDWIFNAAGDGQKPDCLPVALSFLEHEITCSTVLRLMIVLR